MSNNIFAVATRQKYRFPFNGQISVEDLWDLSPAQLDRVYKALKKDQKASNEETLLTVRTTEDAVLDDKIELVKYIFETKQTEKAAAILKAESDAKKNHIREIITAKKDKQLEDLSVEELEKLLEE
jgi:hypothetical protein